MSADVSTRHAEGMRHGDRAGLLLGSDRGIRPFGMMRLAGIPSGFYVLRWGGDGMPYCLEFSTGIRAGWVRGDLSSIELER